MLADLRFAWRTLRRNPGFTLTAVAVLAAGIGANVAIFGIVNAVLLKPLPYPGCERIVQLRGSTPSGDYNPTSIPRYFTYRALTGVLEDVAAYDWNGGSGVNLAVGGRLEEARGEHVNTGFFRLFGARWIVGRPFSDDEDRPGGPRVAILSAGLWKRRFGADTGIAGKSILLGGDPYTVIGVAAPEFSAGQNADLWLPLQADPETTNHSFFIYCAARLAPGVTLAQARAALQVAAETFRRKYPGTRNPNTSFTAQPLIENLTGEIRPALLVLLGAVACLLLIACANVANLLLVRALGREREMAIRVAVGATRRQLAWQLMAESGVLAAIGGALGLATGAAALRALPAFMPDDLPRISTQGSAQLDARVLVFAIGVTLFTGILFGLAPALHASRTDLAAAMRVGRSRTRGAMTIAEVAIAMMLLVGAGLLLRTFDALRRMPTGVDARNVLTFETSLTGSRFDTAAAVVETVRQTQGRLGAMPGVESVAVGPSLPLDASIGMTFNIDGRPPGKNLYHGGATWLPVTPAYFDVFRIPILRGRGFDERDNATVEPVIVISQRMAHEFWPHEDPIGHTVSIYGGGDDVTRLHCRIVGVAGDVHQYGMREELGDAIYCPFAQLTDGFMRMQRKIAPLYWMMRTRGAVLSVAVPAQRTMERDGFAAAHFRAMDDVSRESLARDRFNTILMGLFAGTAILLAGIGLYGLMAYSVQQRTREFGIRMALGAGARDVRRLVVGQAMMLAFTGILAGGVAAWVLTRWMSALLFGVHAHDPLVFIAVPIVLAAVALAAAYVPTRRALQVQPLEALRYE